MAWVVMILEMTMVTFDRTLGWAIVCGVRFPPLIRLGDGAKTSFKSCQCRRCRAGGGGCGLLSLCLAFTLSRPRIRIYFQISLVLPFYTYMSVSFRLFLSLYIIVLAVYGVHTLSLPCKLQLSCISNLGLSLSGTCIEIFLSVDHDSSPRSKATVNCQ
jgi:hypothetical protein